jgi:hypothetical protein
MPHLNYLAVDVEITTMSRKEMHMSKFDSSNPFIWNHYRPLPYFEYNNKFDNANSFNGGVYWTIEEELTINTPSLDLKKAFNCFNQLPSKGAKYTIKLCVDVPDNNNPVNLPPQSGSETGHSFIVVSKSNGSKSITQVFGFYAAKHPGYFFPWREMPSVIYSNQLREINASIEMTLTEKQVGLLREKAFELAKRKYAAASFNCTNYALDLFNSIRTSPLTIETYTVYLPNDNNVYGTSKINTLKIDKTPQMLFKKLNEMKTGKDNEASNIIIDKTDKTKAPLTHGECD